MRHAAIVAPVRTPVGAVGGSLASVPIKTLAARVLTETVTRAGLDPARIDDVVLAQSYPNGETPCRPLGGTRGQPPVEIPGMQVDWPRVDESDGTAPGSPETLACPGFGGVA